MFATLAVFHEPMSRLKAAALKNMFLMVTFRNFKESPERAVPCCAPVKITVGSRVRWAHKTHLQIHTIVQVKQRHDTDMHIQTVAQL